MAIKVQGTTVIDDSRNLQNLVNLNNSGNVYANTFIGDGSQLTNLPPSGGSFEATASGTLSDGSTVILNSDGTVSAVSQTSVATSVGTSSTFESANSDAMSAAYDSVNQKVVIAYRDRGNSQYGTAVVGTVSGMSISFGTPVVFSASSTFDNSVIYDPDQQKIVIAYRDAGNSDKGKVIVGTVSGTSISFGTAVLFENANCNQVRAVYDSNNQKVIIVCKYASAFRYNVGTVSGTSISFDSSSGTTWNNTNSYSLTTVYEPSAQRIVAFYRDASNSSYGTAVVGTVSGTSISFGTPVVFESANSQSISAVYDPDNQKLVVTYKDTGNSNYGTAIVGTVSGTSISFGTPVVFESDTGTFQYQSSPRHSVYDSNVQKVVLAYRIYNDSDNPARAIVGTVSGTSISFETAVSLDSKSLTNEYIAVVYDSNAKKVVVAGQDRSNDYGISIVVQASGDISNLSSTNYVGISNGAYANGATATIQIKGAVDDAQSGLTPGQHYFVQANGSINTTADSPSVFAGTAIASNKLIVKG